MTEEFIAPEMNDETLAQYRAMIKAAEAGDKDKLLGFLEAGLDPNLPVLEEPYLPDSEARHYTSPLRSATLKGHLPLVKLLMEEWNADPELVLKPNESLFSIAVNQFGNQAVASYLIDSPAIHDTPNGDGKVMWEELLFGNIAFMPRMELLDQLLNSDRKLTMANYAAKAICQLSGSEKPELLARLIDRLEADGNDLSEIKEQKNYNPSQIHFPMLAAASYNSVASMQVLKDRGFAINAPRNPEAFGRDAITSPLMVAAEHEISRDAFHLLDAWGVNLHATSPTRANLLFYALENADSQPEYTLEILRHGLRRGVEILPRDDEFLNDPVLNHVLPTATLPCNPDIIDMLVAGGLSVSAQEKLLDKALAYANEPFFDSIFRQEYRAFIDETVRPYAQLPARAPEDVSGITRAKLCKKNEHGLCLLDHPNTWFRFDEIQAALETRGEAFAPEELREGVLPHSGMNYLAAITRYHGISQVQTWMEMQGDSITTNDLLTADGKPAHVMKSVTKLGVLPELFSQDFWRNRSPQELKKVYGALGETQQSKITNMHQLSVSVSRPSQRMVG